MKKIDWTNITAKQSVGGPLPSGGYVCTILRVEDIEDKDYLRIEFDITEGDYKDYFLQQSRTFWSGTFIRSYKQGALPYFKAFLDAVKDSNPGFDEDHFEDPQKLVQCKVGLLIGHETYWNRSGEKKNRIYVATAVPVDTIHSGAFKIPKDREDTYNRPKATVTDDFANAPATDDFDEVADLFNDDEMPF